MKANDASARERLLRAALKHFADRGYAGASVQEIVDEAKVTKPTLYYYFGNKAGLYHALIDLAYDERLRLLQHAAQQGATLAEKLTAIIHTQFEFALQNRDLMRIGFATMFAAPREVPNPAHCLARAQRNFNFLVQLIREAQQRGEINPALDTMEITLAVYGLMAFHVLAYLANPDHPLTRERAEFISRFFLQGLQNMASSPLPAAAAAASAKRRSAPPRRR
jgi:AcrR family transcriptional regulator